MSHTVGCTPAHLRARRHRLGDVQILTRFAAAGRDREWIQSRIGASVQTNVPSRPSPSRRIWIDREPGGRDAGRARGSGVTDGCRRGAASQMWPWRPRVGRRWWTAVLTRLLLRLEVRARLAARTAVQNECSTTALELAVRRRKGDHKDARL